MQDQQQTAIDLIHGLVAIPSVSYHEQDASAWLVEQMQALGYERAFVDEAGNAVGEMGASDASKTILLLGHIDTVPGDIPVRIVSSEEGPILYGRGSVDAKGPLATFTAAVGRVGAAWAHENDVRLVVVGAVEEEAATSKGARFIRDRFNGEDEPIPNACIIGEPSTWHRVTRGYKGRVLVEMNVSQPMAHTAGPDAGVGTFAVELWNWVTAFADEFNAQPVSDTPDAEPKERTDMFDQILPSLREINTWTDRTMHDHVRTKIGIRVPLGFDYKLFVIDVLRWARDQVGNGHWEFATDEQPDTERPSFAEGPYIILYFHGYEPAWRSDRNNALIRSFSRAIRQTAKEVAPGTRPGIRVKSGTSDMNVVGPAWNCPIVAYGPGDAALDHTPNEHIYLDEYERAVQVLVKALENAVGMV